MNCGDNVYESGTDDEYQRYFFPVYNAEAAGPLVGAPLLRSVPFYTVIANHDVQDKDANGHEIADFKKNPDALAYYTAMHLPLNGPDTPAYQTPTMGPESALVAFKSSAGERFPRWRTIHLTTAMFTSCVSTRIDTSTPMTRLCRAGLLPT
jgi:hypothetical protein